MKKIITADEFYNEDLTPLENMIEFAKMHVETALYIASEMADLTDNGRFPYVDKTSILNSYSLNNIK